MITVVMGPSCSGKSTFVEQNKQLGDVVVDWDLISQAVGSDNPHDAPEDVKQVTFAARAAAIARIFDGIEKDAWIIWHDLTDGKIIEYGERGVKFHVMDTPLETCLERAREDGRPEGTEERIREWFDDPPVIPPEYEKGAAVQTKHITVGIKAQGDSLGEGQFTGYASVFGNQDSHGDVVLKGAFSESLKSYGERGSGIPVYWSHQMSDPQMWIGKTLEAYEDDHGLFVKVQLNTDTDNGAQVHRMVKEGVVNQMSFAFDVEDFAFATSEEFGDYLELRKLKIHEVSVVQVGANQSTELLAVKERIAQLKDGRSLSKSNEGQLREAISLIEGVLSSLDESDPDDDEQDPDDDEKSSKDSGDQPVNPAQPDVAQGQAKSGGHPDLALANINMIALEGDRE